MLAVSNTSPISNLAIIGRLALLKAQFPEVWIPSAVFEELRLHPDRAALAEIEGAFRDGWIKTAGVSSSALLSLLLPHLHPGEAEAIALAAELKAGIVLIDEQEGRQYAIQAGLSVTGVLGILLRAKSTGTIALVKPEIQALKDRARFFISPALQAQVLAAAGE